MKVIEKLVTYDELLKKLDGQDPIAWAKEYIRQLHNQEKEERIFRLFFHNCKNSINKLLCLLYHRQYKNEVFADPHCVWPRAGSAVPAGAKQTQSRESNRDAKAIDAKARPPKKSNPTDKSKTLL